MQNEKSNEVIISITFSDSKVVEGLKNLTFELDINFDDLVTIATSRFVNDLADLMALLKLQKELH